MSQEPVEGHSLRRECEAWRSGDLPGFQRLVAHACDIAAETPRNLARHFEVSQATVERWANGLSRPHSAVQEQVVEYLARHVALIGSPGVEAPSNHGPPLDQIEVAAILDRADLSYATDWLKEHEDLVVEAWLGDGALAVVRRDGRKVALVYPGRVVFHESASQVDRIAIGAAMERYNAAHGRPVR